MADIRNRDDQAPSFSASLAIHCVIEILCIGAIDRNEWKLAEIHQGRPWTPADEENNVPRDSDGTIRTRNEGRYGIAPNRRVVFVSAGPDQRFGLSEEFNSLDADDSDAAIAKARADNIYSVDVDFPRLMTPP